MKIDLLKLESGLETLSGKDFVEAEKEERIAGNATVFIASSAGFQARIAARALKTNPRELESLSLPEYNQMIMTVFNFLNQPLEGKETES